MRRESIAETDLDNMLYAYCGRTAQEPFKREKRRKVFITKPFENDTKTDDYIKRAKSYNILLKDLPVKEMYNSNSIEDLTKQIEKIFEVIRKQIKL